MKIRDLIQRVNKTKQFEESVYISDFAEGAFDIPYITNWEDQSRLTSYYLGNWHCTDQAVGYKVYFFDDEPVGVSTRFGRKMDEEFEWISMESYKKVKDYILSFVEVYEPSPPMIDLEQELGDTYKIDYYEQMYEHHKSNAMYNGEKVKILKHKSSFKDEGGIYHPETLQIQCGNGSKIWVEASALDFPFNVR